MGPRSGELRQRNLLKDDPGYLFCIPPGGPRQFQSPYGVQFVEDRDRKRFRVHGRWKLHLPDHLYGRAGPAGPASRRC